MKKICITICAVLFPGFLLAQSHVIHGVVQTLETIPLIGATVRVKSTGQSVETDSLGNFRIYCEPKDKLRISATGFYAQNVKIAPHIKVVAVNLKLKPGDKQRQQAIGYGYVSEEDLSIAVSGVETTSAVFQKYNSMTDLIRDQVPGAQISQGEVILRTAGSFQGSDAALIVVDGVIVDSDYLNSLSPLDVKSVGAIKDGTSAIYGSRGANGVILIETRKGGEGIK